MSDPQLEDGGQRCYLGYQGDDPDPSEGWYQVLAPQPEPTSGLRPSVGERLYTEVDFD